MKKYAIIVAGGTGKRMGESLPKQFLKLGGTPILIHTLQAFNIADPEIELIITLPKEEIQFWDELNVWHQNYITHKVVAGGETRFHSVKNALEHVDEGLVAIHDGVRPFVSPDIIYESFKLASEKQAVITAVKMKDSVRQLTEDGKSKNIDRSTLRMVQTPQTFTVDLLKSAYNTEFKNHFTDDASVVEAYGKDVSLIEGDYRNIKITTPEDLVIAEALLANK
ncbi:2-C-methyl-D-erythritol 4-phosphate cytidylyltransferase [Marivirga arenosa]|uniref:2-C-methyl-D-erythritol 4-phosphate cytidylyltransferase n=1 Tax=Marivirga arenosa TaxID=3059076 RepID=A0AA51N4A9_9BACT|nr:2-C-methyl-D-erythritol 4-phosphate cytidylyltransferase [Marivirga sp. ABR2-2]WMN05964.1 2-C-methyl-D-erythritol 4-phosphate cytidylyltransferase [Marivirga sp. ABR2-2]